MNPFVKINRYLLNELKLKPFVVEMISDRLQKYDDIRDEFLQWLDIRDFSGIEKPLTVHGYTAAQIHEIGPDLTGAGVYDFLVTLRDKPETAMRYLEEGFKFM